MLKIFTFLGFYYMIIMIRVKVMKDKRGQALVEYILIIALISVIAIALVNYLGGYLKDAITKTSCSLSDEVYVKGKKAGEGKCEPKEEQENN